MGLTAVRRRLMWAVVDVVEVLTGEELLTVVTRDESGVLTPWVMHPNAELLADTLNGWMDNIPWNSPKSL